MLYEKQIIYAIASCCRTTMWQTSEITTFKNWSPMLKSMIQTSIEKIYKKIMFNESNIQSSGMERNIGTCLNKKKTKIKHVKIDLI